MWHPQRTDGSPTKSQSAGLLGRAFQGSGYAYGIDANDFLVSVVDKIAVGDALCMCEGEGRNSTHLEFEIARQKSHVRATLMKASAEIAAGAAVTEYQNFHVVSKCHVQILI